MVETIEECMEELRFYSVQGILSDVQVSILEARIYNRFTYEHICSHFRLVKNALIHCIVRSSEGRRWEPGMSGGGYSYLSDIDILKFKSLAEQAADDLNCLTTPCAVSLAVGLKKSRLAKAKMILVHAQCSGLIVHLHTEVSPPSKAWLKEFAHSLELNVVNSQTIDSIRRTACDITQIELFFAHHHLLLDRHPCLILNMDETMLSARRKFKVLSFERKLPLTPSAGSYPHLTGVVTVSGIGKCFEPTIILPNKKTSRGIEGYDVTILSSTSGWMTKRLFLLYVIDLISQISLYRLSLPENLRRETFLLIVDGHSSRGCFMAALLLYIFDIELLLLPPHSSHVMQPFDVSVASPLKTEFTKRMIKRCTTLNLENMSIEQILKLTASETRDSMVICFLEALRKVTTSSNIKEGFCKSGLIPCDPSLPIISQYILPSAIATKRKNNLSNKLLNSEESLVELFYLENEREAQEADFQINPSEMIKYIWNDKKNVGGLALTRCPPIYTDAVFPGFITQLA